jgi:hypothetical protein
MKEKEKKRGSEVWWRRGIEGTNGGDSRKRWRESSYLAGGKRMRRRIRGFEKPLIIFSLKRD